MLKLYFFILYIGTSVQPLATNLLGAKPKTGMNSLLDQHSNLVNLDNLVTDSKKEAQNPFENTPQNPFQAVKSAQKPAMNQLLVSQTLDSKFHH